MSKYSPILYTGLFLKVLSYVLGGLLALVITQLIPVRYELLSVLFLLGGGIGLIYIMRRLIFYPWLASTIRSQKIPFDVLLEELVLRRVVEGFDEIWKVTDWAKAKGRLDPAVISELYDAFRKLEKPKPYNTTGETKLGYNQKMDWLYILIGLLLFGVIVQQGGLFILFLCWPLLIVLAPFVHRINKYGSNYYLKISADGVLFGQQNQFVAWNEIVEVEIYRHESNEYYKYQHNRYSLYFYFDTGDHYECNIGPYAQGWRKVYRVLKAYSPVPTRLRTLRNGKEL